MTPVDISIFENGGVGLFAGGTNVIQMMHGGLSFTQAVRDAMLSGLIAHLSNSPKGLSHAVLFLPKKYWTDPNMPMLSQSTEYKNLSGPQLTQLHPWIDDEYGTKGGHGWLAVFKDELTPDWDKMVAYQQAQYALREAGGPTQPCYCVPRLFADASEVPNALAADVFAAIPGETAIIKAAQANPNAVVCSQFVWRSTVQGGLDKLCQTANVPFLPRVIPTPGGDWCSPQDWYAMVGLYQKIYQIL
jgi:hypothetical protein